MRPLTAIFLLVIFSDAYAVVTNYVCNSQDSPNVYYQVDVADVEAVSRYYNTLSEDHFSKIDSFKAIKGKRKRTETFYDTRELMFLQNNIELLHIVETKLPLYREDRERVVYKNNNQANPFLKQYEVKRYNKRNTPLDKHPLLGKVKRKERPDLLALLSEQNKTTPLEIAQKLKVEHQEVVYLITHYGKPYAEINMDQIHIANFGVPNTNTLLKYHVYPDHMDDLNQQERDELYNAFCSARRVFEDRFPHLTPISRFGYAEYNAMATGMLPGRIFFQRHSWLFKLGQIFILTICGFLVIYLILGRYHKKIIYNHRKIYIRK
jgi:hypothetical protein